MSFLNTKIKRWTTGFFIALLAMVAMQPFLVAPAFAEPDNNDFEIVPDDILKANISNVEKVYYLVDSSKLNCYSDARPKQKREMANSLANWAAGDKTPGGKTFTEQNATVVIDNLRRALAGTMSGADAICENVVNSAYQVLGEAPPEVNDKDEKIDAILKACNASWSGLGMKAPSGGFRALLNSLNENDLNTVHAQATSANPSCIEAGETIEQVALRPKAKANLKALCTQGNHDEFFASVDKLTDQQALDLYNSVDTCADAEQNIADIQTEGQTDVNCSINNALGWIICPVAEALQGITVFIAHVIDGLLTVRPLPLNPGSFPENDARRSIYNTWSAVRNLANIALVFSFFAIVFSQATSLGISSYGIKKLLPKLVIVAIGINLSYFMCALAIDVFNLLGGGVQGIFGAANNVVNGQSEGTDDATWGDLAINVGGLAAAAIGSFVAFTPAVFGLWWPLILPMVATAATSFLIALLVLVFREVAIVILIIMSPLALAAWLLPGTEGLFKKWRSLFTSLLVMYPLIMGIFYGSILTSNIIRTAGIANTQNAFDEAIANVIGLGVLAVPLFTLPFLIKFTGSIGQKFGGLLNNPNKGLIDRSRKKADELRGRTAATRMKDARKSERHARHDRHFASSMAATGPEGDKMRKRYSGWRAGQFTAGQRKDAAEAQSNVYDAYRENLSKTTERTRGRLTDGGSFTAGTKYFMKNAQGEREEVDKDSFMKRVYIDHEFGETETLSGDKMQVDGSDKFVRSAIASQAAKSGDKAMFGKLLSAAQKEGKSEEEFTLRDFGINNSSTVVGGHPDVVKGRYSGFKAVSVDGLLNMDGSAVERMANFLGDPEKIKAEVGIGMRAKIQDLHPEWSATQVEDQVDSDINDYRQGAYQALQHAVDQINTNRIYAGKAPASGDLAKAIKKQFGASYEIKDQSTNGGGGGAS